MRWLCWQKAEMRQSKWQVNPWILEHETAKEILTEGFHA
jgi:hypothetical protein